MSGHSIDLRCVKEVEPDFIYNLDKSFFRVRYDRATKREKDFMFGMVRCGDLPCTIAEVANQMGTTPKSIGPLRSQLVHKGFIYATSYGEIDFTVPQFDRYLLRINPDLIIDHDRTM